MVETKMIRRNLKDTQLRNELIVDIANGIPSAARCSVWSTIRTDESRIREE